MKKRIKLSKSVLLFSLLSSAFVIYLGLTLYQSEDAIQIKRYILLAYTIGTVVLFSFLFSNLSKIVQYNILKKTIIFSVIIYLVFCGIESYAFIKLGSNPGGNFYDWIEIYPDTIGFFLPRLSGGFIDPNLAAFYLIAMYFFADFLSLKRWIKLLIIVLIFLTISRSAIAILIILMIINLLSKKWKIDFSFRPKIAIKLLLTFIIAMTGIAAGSLYILNNYSNRVNTQYFLIGINNRFGHDLSEGSGSIHRQLITKGFNDSFTHYVYALIGHGYGSSLFLAKTFFNNDKHSNLHSEYITFLYEGGIIGLFIYLSIILFVVLKASKKKMSLLLICGAFILANITYQQYVFMYYWIVMSIICILKCDYSYVDNKIVSNIDKNAQRWHGSSA